MSVSSNARKKFLFKNKVKGIYELIKKYSTKKISYHKDEDYEDPLISVPSDKESVSNESEDKIKPHINADAHTNFEEFLLII